MLKSLLLLAAAAALTSHVAHAASFPCAKAARPVEKLICGDAKLNAADESMGLAYRTQLEKLTPATVGLLRADQVQWLAWLQETCQVPDGKTVRANAAKGVATCMLSLYAERTKALRGAVAQRGGMRFLMRTQYLALPEDDAKQHPEWHAFGTLQATWPAALTDAPEWIAWNHAAEAAAFALAAEDTWSNDKPIPKTMEWTPGLAEAADTQITVRVRSVEHGRVTSSMSMDTVGHGAAHPSETAGTMTWLLADKRALRATDVFQPGDAWKRVVGEACWKAIRTGDKKEWIYPQVNGPETKALQAVIADEHNWMLEHDGLHISYPENAVSSRVAGMDDTVIPWAALQPVLAKGFVAP